MGMEIEHASGKIRDKHVADEEEDYAGVPAWSALYPVTQVIGAPSECERQIPGLERPEGMADFEPGDAPRRADDQELPRARSADYVLTRPGQVEPDAFQVPERGVKPLDDQGRQGGRRIESTLPLT